MNSGISAVLFEKIKKKYGPYSSWAIWNEVGTRPKSRMDASIFEKNTILATLHTKYILVALNISRAIDIPLGNFHSTDSAATDYKTRYALIDTPLWGSYMTDIIKDFEEVASGKMREYLKKNPTREKENIQSFLEELRFIGAENPVLVAIGDDSYKILQRNLAKTYQIIKIPHYANYTSKELFRSELLLAISQLEAKSKI